MATRDPLTGLFNRRYLDESLVRDLARAGRARESLCVAMLDIDRFKSFNDENGHEAGDAVLKAIADVLKRETRAGDVACRFGGEEFVLVLYGADMSHAMMRLNRICAVIKRKRVAFDGKPLPAVTLSVGLAMSPEHGTTREELLRAADRALYAAKRSGRGRVVAFSDQVTAQAASLAD